MAMKTCDRCNLPDFDDGVRYKKWGGKIFLCSDCRPVRKAHGKLEYMHTITPTGLERVMRVDAKAAIAELNANHKNCNCNGEAGCWTNVLDKVNAVTVARRPKGGQWMVRDSEYEGFKLGDPPEWKNTLFPIRVTL